MDGLKSRIVKRAETADENSMARKDEKYVDKSGKKLSLQNHWTKTRTKKRRDSDDAKRQRRLPKCRRPKDLPSMFVRHLPARRDLFHWHCGYFPT